MKEPIIKIDLTKEESKKEAFLQMVGKLAKETIRVCGIEDFMENLVLTDNEFICDDDGVSATSKIIDTMRGIRKYALGTISLDDDVKAQWNAHFEVVKKEHEKRLRNLLQEEMERMISEEVENDVKEIKFNDYEEEF